jgi:hypothetical protein
VEKVSGPTESYEDFSASLHVDECRYAVYGFDFDFLHCVVILIILSLIDL